VSKAQDLERASAWIANQLLERRSIDIGGARLDAVVAGSGPVTVIFENGLATALEAWDAIAPEIEARARVVATTGGGPTPAGDVRVRTASDMWADLRTLLAALAIRPPYVLVGHSWGGVVTRTLRPRLPGRRLPASCSWTPRTK
jgi:pimeloyl-ACP methyl ester carboxylesterase